MRDVIAYVERLSSGRGLIATLPPKRKTDDSNAPHSRATSSSLIFHRRYADIALFAAATVRRSLNHDQSATHRNPHSHTAPIGVLVESRETLGLATTRARRGRAALHSVSGETDFSKKHRRKWQRIHILLSSTRRRASAHSDSQRIRSVRSAAAGRPRRAERYAPRAIFLTMRMQTMKPHMTRSR